MVTTRKQQALQAENEEAAGAPDNLTKRPAPAHSSLKPTSDREKSTHVQEPEESEPPTKKVKLETPAEEGVRKEDEDGIVREAGTTERGHIYFFFRPRVERAEPSSLDDVKNLHMLLVPRPPRFSAADETRMSAAGDSQDMQVLQQGEDAVPAPAPLDSPEQHYRLITIGKKTLPDPDVHRGRKESFWATVVAVGDDLNSLEKGMAEKTYETKTRGTRHDPPARLVARGCYALVNNEADKPSQETTYLGYSLSHPAPSEFGPVQTALGIHRAAAFVLQVKNPQAPANDSGASTTKPVVYPDEIMDVVFGKETRGRESTGLHFAPCSRPQMLDYNGVELLLVAIRGDESGLEESLGEGRGEAMTEAAEADKALGVGEIFRELWGGQDADMLPEALNGEWI
ncbi:hypothetical protein DFH07DRAFT_849355 [Mycena maculata]|uniref:Uncharacterized protein n=1 Tax=Mycena maculata TaxID=230809 RepID=A0AAD7HX37_9AGAR|nr:hypothetical protein DFH07DRAFT_849355 [Mycena maculata]